MTNEFYKIVSELAEKLAEAIDNDIRCKIEDYLDERREKRRNYE